MPKVSVIIPIYNPKKEYLEEALDSVLGQTFQNIEIIVVDDGSPIDPSAILAPYRDKIRFFEKDNGGANTARQLGLQYAKGEYIALIDNDDRWVRDKLDVQVRCMDQAQDIDLLFSNFQNFNEKGPIGQDYFFGNKVIYTIPSQKRENIHPDLKVFNSNILEPYLRGNFIIQCTLMVRADICRREQMFKTKTFGRELYEFGTRTFHRLRLGYLDRVLAQRRIHQDNITRDMAREYTNTILICEDAINYPWMDNNCRRFLHNENIRSHIQLGKYHFVKGDIFRVREALHNALKNQWSLTAYGLLFLTYVFPSKIVLLLKKFVHAIWNRDDHL